MSDERSEARERWKRYYELSRAWPTREFLLKSVGRFESPGFAIDLGCGNGTESLFLLEQGWRVLAIDAQELAIETLIERTPPEAQSRLETAVASFETLTLPEADFIWSGNSLPFCHPDYFDALWGKIRTAVKPNGRFAGDLFGPRHEWVGNDSMNFHTKVEIINLLDGLTLEYLIEEEGQQPTTLGFQHWHAFALCAHKNA